MLDDPTRISISEVHVNDHGYAVTCSGVSASWCPIHGDCTCERYPDGSFPDGMDSPDCPLHGFHSDHADHPPQWMQRPSDGSGVWYLVPLDALSLSLSSNPTDWSQYPRMSARGWTAGEFTGPQTGLEGVKYVLDTVVYLGQYSQRVIDQVEIPSTLEFSS